MQGHIGPSPARIGRKGAKIISETSHTASAATKLMIDSRDDMGYGGDRSGFMTIDDNAGTDRESRQMATIVGSNRSPTEMDFPTSLDPDVFDGKQKMSSNFNIGMRNAINNLEYKT